MIIRMMIKFLLKRLSSYKKKTHHNVNDRENLNVMIGYLKNDIYSTNVVTNISALRTQILTHNINEIFLRSS